jgi:hypothetical protein
MMFYATSTNTTYPMPLCYHKATVGLMPWLLKQGAPKGAGGTVTRQPIPQKIKKKIVDMIRPDI